MLTPDEFRLLAEKLRPYTQFLYFHLMGEPLLHPELRQFLLDAGQLDYQVMITTNGTLLPERGSILLESNAVHKVNISLQSFEANSTGRLEHYLTGCIDFVKKAAKKGILCE